MSDKLFEIDSAMNLIKEDVIRELFESVSRQNCDPYINDVKSNNLPFSESNMD